MKGAMIFFLANCCAFLLAQQPLQFSRNFISFKKNLPAQIINNHSSYFYVVRQNKVAHDITIERRAKPSGEIVSFTPLKLDSVNASWFDYENLDYLVFEKDYKVYFVFEKVLNTRRAVYLKIIDTTGKSTGFIELAVLERDNNTADFYFSFHETENGDILLASTKIAVNGLNRTSVTLYSTERRSVVWIRKLPLVNERLAEIVSMACNKDGNLIYLQGFYSVTGTESYSGITRTITRLDSIVLWNWKSSGPEPIPHTLDIWGLHRISGFVITKADTTFLSIKGLEYDSVKNTMIEVIYNIGLNGSNKTIFDSRNFYDPKIKEQLTFYDGPENASFSKEHHLVCTYINGHSVYALLERSEQGYYKELLLRSFDDKTGRERSQKIIPRKIFFFRGRTRFKQLAEPMLYTYNARISIVLLEHPLNFRVNPGNFNHRSMKKETNLSGANIVAYSLRSDGDFEKTLIYKNSAFDLVPLTYSGSEADMVFYLYNNKYEKFAIWTPYP